MRSESLRQPYFLAAGHELQREQHRDHLEHVGRAAGGERQRRHGQQQHEREREGAPPEAVVEAAQRLRALAGEPLFQQLAGPGGSSGASPISRTWHVVRRVTRRAAYLPH